MKQSVLLFAVQVAYTGELKLSKYALMFASPEGKFRMIRLLVIGVVRSILYLHGNEIVLQ